MELELFIKNGELGKSSEVEDRSDEGDVEQREFPQSNVI